MQVTLFASWVLPLKTDRCVANRVDKDMKQIVIELSEDLAQQVGPYQNRLEELVLLGLSQLKIQEALTLYARGIVSFARAAEIAGCSRPEMIRQAQAAGVKPRWSEEMAADELA
ncbi:MAG: UPF0175 family protein [Caldilinea sp.]